MDLEFKLFYRIQTLLHRRITRFIHGYDFYIVGEGFGNFNPKKDTSKFNLVDPPLRNTVAVPVNGWAVIRFVADNPGN